MTLIYGQVFDPLGHPVGEASVYVVSAPIFLPDIAQLTDDQGRFVISTPARGIYILGVHSDVWGTVQKLIDTQEEEVLSIEVQFISREDQTQ